MSLETFAPTPRTVTLNDGRRVDILPLRLRQMPAFTRAAKPVAGLLFIADYFTLLEEHPEVASDIIQTYLGWDAEVVGALFQDETVRLISAIYEVNGDFFIQRLRPAMTQATEGAAAQIAKLGILAGPQPLPGSGSTGSASTPAST
jgi:hypothetical protein